MRILHLLFKPLFHCCMIDKMDFMGQNVTEKRPFFRGVKTLSDYHTHTNTLLNSKYNFIFRYSLIEVPKIK